MGSIDSRLRRLEERGCGDVCPECGLAPDERRLIAVINVEHPERSFDGDPYEACASCAEPLYIVLRIVYDSPGDIEGGRG